jgi:DNA-binding response OmpR family regulator
MAKVLLVDDDPDVCELLAIALAEDGHQVVIEHDGDAALAVVEAARPDLVLLDWVMPRLGGLDVCLILRAEPQFADLPVLILTARTRPEDLVHGLLAGVDDYLLKPTRPSEVRQAVAALLGRTPE